MKFYPNEEINNGIEEGVDIMYYEISTYCAYDDNFVYDCNFVFKYLHNERNIIQEDVRMMILLYIDVMI